MIITVKVARKGMKPCEVCSKEIAKGDRILRFVSKAFCDTKTANICKDCVDYFNDVLFGRRVLS